MLHLSPKQPGELIKVPESPAHTFYVFANSICSLVLITKSFRYLKRRYWTFICLTYSLYRWVHPFEVPEIFGDSMKVFPHVAMISVLFQPALLPQPPFPPGDDGRLAWANLGHERQRWQRCDEGPWWIWWGTSWNIYVITHRIHVWYIYP